ncbi:hypothetical protein GCM10017562_70020 [Streptomyces roseofulvus]|uniref:hypothetical protein n=1 Tax=Streptomyces roseofulvus TaxID=33902 RepID=UPI0031FDCF39
MLGRALPFLVIVLATLADVLTPPVERFDRFLIAAPALAAATWSARGTAAIGTLAMAATAVTAAVLVVRDGPAAPLRRIPSPPLAGSLRS